MSFCEFYEIFNKTCFAEHLRKIYDMEANTLAGQNKEDFSVKKVDFSEYRC